MIEIFYLLMSNAAYFVGKCFTFTFFPKCYYLIKRVRYETTITLLIKSDLATINERLTFFFYLRLKYRT